MKVDISALIIGSKSAIDVEYQTNYNLTDEIDVSSAKIICKGKIFSKNDAIFVDVAYTADMEALCSRCLEPITSVFENRSLDMICDKQANAQEDMQYLLEGKTFLLSEYVIQDLIINNDYQMLCSEDCLGLCSECGLNLNNEKCTCDSISVDPRLSALKDFFADKGGVENGSTKEKNVKS